MGSLMAGWDSHHPHPNFVEISRNTSLTKDDIEAYWKSKKEKEEEHLRDISLLSPRTQKTIFEEGVEGASSEPLKKLLIDMESEPSLEKVVLKNGWWMSSKSAFLNEPPVIGQEGTAQRYASQFHVPDMASSTTAHGTT